VNAPDLCGRCGKRLFSTSYACKFGHRYDAPCANAAGLKCEKDGHLLFIEP
jgi:hypothetical protein